MFDLPRWKSYHYEAIQHFQLLKGYNPNTSNYTRKNGFPFLNLVWPGESNTNADEGFHEWQILLVLLAPSTSADLDREGKLILIH